jgi:hypothetical protein
MSRGDRPAPLDTARRKDYKADFEFPGDSDVEKNMSRTDSTDDSDKPKITHHDNSI